ncbi:MAG TPA: hypothetical protein VNH11_18900 [Pirellulales bacterium]|nr:hypothetical protein [Pirellulales bacterium]
MMPAYSHQPGFRNLARLGFCCAVFFTGVLPARPLHAQPSIDFLPASGSGLANGRFGPTVVAPRCSLRIQRLEPNDFVQVLIDGTVVRKSQCEGHAMVVPLKGLSSGWHAAEARVTRRRNREVSKTTKTVERFPDREKTTTVEEKHGNAEVLYTGPQFFEVANQMSMHAGFRTLGFARLCSANGEPRTLGHNENRFLPFSVLPIVRPVPGPQSITGLSALPAMNQPAVSTVPTALPTGAAHAPAEAGWLTFCFDDPARFRLPEFAQCGVPLPTVGAVIYEGMRFSVGPHGRYRVSFEIQTPAMPLKLNMQLLVESDSFGPQTVTMPPVSIPSENRSAAREAIYLVQQEGWHPALIADADDLLSVTRRGTTCRFGFGLDVP